MSLIHLPHDASADDVVRCLDAEGYCIIDNAISEELVDAINDQMQPYIGATDDGANNALGKQTRRSGAIIARSPAAHPVIMHPAVVGAAQKYLGRNASKIQLHLTQVISIGPGNKEQFLHRDEGCWEWFDHFPLNFKPRSAPSGHWMTLSTPMALPASSQVAISIQRYRPTLIWQTQ